MSGKSKSPNTGAPKRQYFHLLNALRGIAAILVVARHTSVFAPFWFPVSYMAVDLFFLLSGVVIEASYRNQLVTGMTVPKFTWIRIARIYPLYALGSAITILALLLAPGHHILNGSAPSDISHPAVRLLFGIVMLPTLFHPFFSFNYPAWSLFFELVVNIFYAYIVAFLTNRWLVRAVAFFGAGLIACLVYFHHENVIQFGLQAKTLFPGLFRTGFSFFLGVGLYRLSHIYHMDFVRKHSAIASLVIIGLAGTILMAQISPDFEIYFYSFSVFAAFPALVFTALAVETGRIARRVWDFFGDISYAVYTLHFPLYLFACSVIVTRFDRNLFLHPWSGAVFLVILLALSYALDKTYDKTARKFLRDVWRDRSKKASVPAVDAQVDAMKVSTGR